MTTVLPPLRRASDRESFLVQFVTSVCRLASGRKTERSASTNGPFFDAQQIRLRGLHNLENVMAAALIAHLAGAPL